MDLIALTIQCMVVKKIVLSQLMKKIKKKEPQKGDIDKIVSFFYYRCEGEAVRKR